MRSNSFVQIFLHWFWLTSSIYLQKEYNTKFLIVRARQEFRDILQLITANKTENVSIYLFIQSFFKLFFLFPILCDISLEYVFVFRERSMLFLWSKHNKLHNPLWSRANRSDPYPSGRRFVDPVERIWWSLSHLACLMWAMKKISLRPMPQILEWGPIRL